MSADQTTSQAIAHEEKRRLVLTADRPIRSSEFPEHADFLRTVAAAARLYDSAGIPRTDWMVNAGGSIALRQLARGHSDRVPTDVDTIMYYRDTTDSMERLRALYEALLRTNDFSNAQFITQPRHQHGLIYDNPIIEAQLNHRIGFPLDILSQMTTIFSSPAAIPSLSGVSYDFPNHERALYDYSHPVVVDGETVKLAHPAYVYFYKGTMNRNGVIAGNSVPKQDNHDLRRMFTLGLFDDPNFFDILHLLAPNGTPLNTDLLAVLQNKLQALGCI